MKKVRKWHIAVGAGVLLLAVVALNPLRWPEAAIRARLLWSTPLGSTMPEVRRVIEGKGWKLDTYSESVGFLDQRAHPYVVTGAKHIRASLGDYTTFMLVLPLPANVTAFWGFDDNGRLVDIWVWRTIDGP